MTEGNYDELDKLTAEYERQAKADLATVKHDNEPTVESKPLDASNRGYQLLKKLGYSEGEGLGANRQGIKDPLSVAFKRDREGLGATKTAKRRARVEKGAEETFRNQMSNARSSKRTAKQLRAARRLIAELDQREGITPNPFWIPEEGDDDVDELMQLSDANALSAAAGYLREQHWYCFWCSCQYVDQEDMARSCPGEEEGEH